MGELFQGGQPASAGAVAERVDSNEARQSLRQLVDDEIQLTHQDGLLGSIGRAPSARLTAAILSDWERYTALVSGGI